jgi:ubiquitin C-terminal hydrolase
MEAFSLLETLVGNRDSMLPIFEFLDAFHKDPTWRTSRSLDWTISPASMEKSSTGYVGLKNLGCICYMNSLMQ